MATPRTAPCALPSAAGRKASAKAQPSRWGQQLAAAGRAQGRLPAAELWCKPPNSYLVQALVFTRTPQAAAPTYYAATAASPTGPLGHRPSWDSPSWSPSCELGGDESGHDADAAGSPSSFEEFSVSLGDGVEELAQAFLQRLQSSPLLCSALVSIQLQGCHPMGGVCGNMQHSLAGG